MLASCGAGEPEPRQRLLVIGLDGFDPRVVEERIAAGAMPTFARLQRDGAHGVLTSAEPMLSPILWTTIATGREPLDHGVTDFTVRGADGHELPVTSRQRRTRALWNLWSQAGRRVAVVGWWATWPAERVRGVMVSDRLGYHFLQRADDPDGLPAVTHPPELVAALRPLMPLPESLGATDLAPFADIEPEEAARPFEFGDELSHLKWAVVTAAGYRDVALRLWRDEDPDVLMVYFEGADTVSHLFGHLHGVEDLSGELLAQQAKYGHTVAAMYDYLDAVVGDLLAAAAEGSTTVAVVSDHGFELGALPADPSKTRDLRRVSHESHRLEGVIYLYGPAIAAGAGIEDAGLLDVAPTLLALTGLPPSEEMPGVVLPAARGDGPQLPRVASYEYGERDSVPEEDVGEAAAVVDQQVLDKLRSLGYLDGAAEVGAVTRNDAALALQAGRYREAARGFRTLIAESPDDPSLHMSLASALVALRRYDQALAACERALELDAAYAPALYVRGQALEGRGDRALAADAYRTAVKYDPRHQRSLAALARLGEPARRVARTAEEVQAAELLQRVSAAQGRGDYTAGLELVAELETLIPEEAIVFQYRSNLCYLLGDLQCAIAALERGLELEPGNSLMAKNLRVLRRKAEEQARQ